MSKIVWKDNIEEYFKQYKNYEKPKYNNKIFYKSLSLLQKSLKKIGVKLYFLKWTKETFNVSLEDFLHNYIKKDDDKIGKKNGYIFLNEYGIYESARTGELYIHHVLNSDITNEVNKILKKYFPNRTLGFTTVNDSIRVYLYDKKLVIPKSYTLYYIYAKYKDNKLILDDKHFNNILNTVTKFLTDKIVYMYYDAYNNTGYFTLFYYVYDDKIKQFEEKVKKLETMKKLNLPKLTDFGIAKN